ncbi:hypothetical protein SH591_07235 [Sphingomonas sp. LY54]|uniref:hypothetical protein n=1 Tax=Sphingomonas sp. LY54 TaxID=3095343 RepID=UPI002D7A1B00|nr:hypothetical protein [Sphingomonas sp. LY54]WRP29963.1 hypothetical protein SH591_07235 [Sphingomonas sp. LY54]
MALASGGMLAGTARAATKEAAAKPAKFEVGKSYFGENQYIEYLPGNAPVILTAPHGGSLRPDTIPDRTRDACAARTVVANDSNTAALVLAMRESFHARFGTYPHVVINRLARRKLDANRGVKDGACGNPDAERALTEWHAFIDAAKAQVLETTGRGWYMDIHGHAHAIPRLELGYLLTGDQIDRTDDELNASAALKGKASVRTLLKGPAPLSTLLRGPTSLGTLFAENGFPAVPSAGDPGPQGERYFGGGDNTRRHTCGSAASPAGGTTDGMICGVQIETNFKGVRDTPENRQRFGDATAIALEKFLGAHWGIELKAKEAVKAAGQK